MDQVQGGGAAAALEFRGRAGEYFRIWIVNVCLTVITLGIYSPQHAVAILRRLAARGGGAGGSFNYLSSHPGLEERVRTLSGRDPG